MGCNRATCRICKKKIKGKDHFAMSLKEMEHTEKFHPKVFKQNMEAELEYKEDLQKALDKKLKNSRLPLFTQTVWDGQDMTDEELYEKFGTMPKDDVNVLEDEA
jgi:hypothetical protein